MNRNLYYVTRLRFFFFYRDCKLEEFSQFLALRFFIESCINKKTSVH